MRLLVPRSSGSDGRSVPLDSLRTLVRCLLLTAVAVFIAAALPYSAHAADKTFTLTVEGKDVSIGGHMVYKGAWTYDGTIPGPVLRVRQGDTVHIHLINKTGQAHGIDVHAAQISPKHFLGDATKSLSYTFRADVPGVFAYHCAAHPVLDHIALGMYGMMIVEPKDGWPNGKAQEVALVQSEIYGTANTKGVLTSDHTKIVAAHPDFVVFNGAINKYSLDNPIKIKVGELVRVFLLNAGPSLTSSFHVSGAIFSTVYEGGNPANALHELNTLEVAPVDGAVFEFRVEQPGNYPFMDLNAAHQYKGAMGIFHAVK